MGAPAGREQRWQQRRQRAEALAGARQGICSTTNSRGQHVLGGGAGARVVGDAQQGARRGSRGRRSAAGSGGGVCVGGGGVTATNEQAVCSLKR